MENRCFRLIEVFQTQITIGSPKRELGSMIVIKITTTVVYRIII